MKKKFILPIILLLAGVAIGFFYVKDKIRYQNMVATAQEVPKWQADTHPLVKKQEIMQLLKKVNKANKQGDSVSDLKAVTIPGLRGAWSIDHKTKKAAFGNDWVPQGLTQSKEDYFVSVYDGDHKLNSLIYVIDKKTGTYKKSLILHSKAHVGGVSYDSTFKRLWFSDDTKEEAGLSYISEPEIQAYQAEKSQEAIHSTGVRLPWASKTSGIALYNNQLIIVKYGLNKDDRSVVAIPLNAQSGLPEKFTKKMDEILDQTTDYNGFIDALIKEKIIQSIAPGWDRMQGLAIASFGLSIFSQSNGDSNSKIWVENPNDKSGTKFDFTPPTEGVRMFQVPPSVEQVSLDVPNTTNFSMLFESGAKKYRETGTFLNRPAIVDRILVLPLKIEYSD